MNKTKKVKWRVGSWKNGGYEIEYLVDGVVNCTFQGVPDERSATFRLKLLSRSPYGSVPKERCVSYFDVNKEIDRA